MQCTVHVILSVNLAWSIDSTVSVTAHLCILYPPCPPIDSIMILMIVWRITGKIIRTLLLLLHMHTYNDVFLQFWV